MNQSRKKKEFRPGGYDSLEERLVLSPGGAGALAAQLQAAQGTPAEQATENQLRNRRLMGRRGLPGRRQFPLRGMRGGGNGGPLGPGRLGLNPVVRSLGFRDPGTAAAVLEATNTASSIVGPNLVNDTTGFANPGFTVSTLAESVAAGQTINNLGFNSGTVNFNGQGLGIGTFANGLGFLNAQSVLGNLARTIDPSLGIDVADLNRNIVTFGGIGQDGTFGLGNPLGPGGVTGFNAGLGLNNNLGFPVNQTPITIGAPLSNLSAFNTLNLNPGVRSTFGLPGFATNPTTGFPNNAPVIPDTSGGGIGIDPTTGFPRGGGGNVGGNFGGTSGTNPSTGGSFGGTSGTIPGGTGTGGSFGGTSGTIPGGTGTGTGGTGGTGTGGAGAIPTPGNTGGSGAIPTPGNR